MARTKKQSNFSVAQRTENFKKEFSTHAMTAEIIIDSDNLEIPNYVEKVDQRLGIIRWGDDNLFPQHLINIMHNTVEHNSIAKRVVDMTVGEGIKIGLENTVEFRRFLNNGISKYSLLDVCDRICWDLITFGCYAFEVIWTRDGEGFNYIKHVPMQNLRRAWGEEHDGFKYCDNWAFTSKFKPRFLAEFDPNLKETHPSQIYFSKIYSPGTETYTLPSYFGGIYWILLSNYISAFHLENAENGYNPGLIFSFKAEPTEEVRRQIKKGMDEQVGGLKNTGKPVLLFSANPEDAPDITTVNPNQNDKQFESLIHTCTQKILSAWRVTDPSIMGIPTAQGLSDSSDRMLMAEYRFQKIVIDSLQMFIQRDLNYLMSFSGIADTFTFNKFIDEEKYAMLKDMYGPAQAQAIQEQDEKQDDNNSNI